MTESSPSPERWLPVPGYEGLYEVSDLGHVRRVQVNLRPQMSTLGYQQVSLSRGGRVKIRFIHQLVLAAFAGPCPEGNVVCHGPGGKLDNRAVNLSYGTRKQNQGPDRVRDGTSNRGERHPLVKLTQAIVDECRRRHAAGETQVSLSREFGVTRSAMNFAIRGRNWKHLQTDRLPVKQPEQ